LVPARSTAALSEPLVLPVLSLRPVHIQTIEKDVADLSMAEGDAVNDDNVSVNRQDIDIINDRCYYIYFTQRF